MSTKTENGSFRGAVLALGLFVGGVAIPAVRPFLGRYRAVVVEGESMTPALQPEDYVLVDRLAYRSLLPEPGAVVLSLDPRATGRTLIKRVLDASAGGVDLRGDNSELSTDSREFGFVAPELLRGRVLLVYWPPRRFGRVR